MECVSFEIDHILDSYITNLKVSKRYIEYSETNIDDIVNILTSHIFRFDDQYIKPRTIVFNYMNEEFEITTTLNKDIYIRLNQLRHIKFIKEV
jgi:hypothetical protein